MGWQKLFGELSIEQMLKHRGRKEKGKKGRQVKMKRWKTKGKTKHNRISQDRQGGG